MNTYQKYVPNVFLAKCEERYNSGDKIMVTTKYGKENECIVFNLIAVKDGFFYHSIIRADGMDAQKYAEKKAQSILSRAAKAETKSDEFYKKSNKDRDFLSLGEPIKIGHHSEKRHRKIIEQANNNMAKCVEFSDKAESLEEKAKYWLTRTDIINLSMPESVEYFEFKLEEAKDKHEGLKDGRYKREHSFSLTYAKKAVNEMEKNLSLAKKLWSPQN